MSNYRNNFHTISYIQYPLFIIGILLFFFSIYEILNLEAGSTIDDIIQIGTHYVNLSFFLFGLAVSFSTLQDTSKTQNQLSKSVWQHPRKGKIALLFISLTAFFFISISFAGMVFFPDSIINKLSYGFLAFGIAYIGVLKAAIEMFEHHRSDRKNQPIN